MVLQVLPHARQIGAYGYAVPGQMRGGSQAGQHQQLRRVDRPG